MLRMGRQRKARPPHGTAGLFPPLERRLLDRLQIHRRGLAATVDLELELDPVAFVEADHAGALDRRNVDEGVGLAVVAADEAEALHRVEELDRALGLFAGQLALRTAAAAAGTIAIAAAAGAVAVLAGRPLLHRHRIAVDLEVGRGDPAAAVDERELERLAVGEAGKPGLLDRRDVDEHVLAAIVADDEAEALLRVEELDHALALADDLRGHSAASAAAAAAEPAAAAAAAEAATAAAAEPAAATAVTAAAAPAAE